MKASKLPTERSFGLLFLLVAAGFGLFGLYKEWSAYAVSGFFLISVVLGLAALVYPNALTPFNKAWFFLGQALGKIVSPIVLGILYFGLLTPIALITKAFGRDELRLKARSVDSYWIKRVPPGPAPTSFKNQF